MLQIAQAPKGAKLSDKFSVWVKQENTSWQSVSVYTALTPDGTSNGICFPDEIYKEFDGLPFGTMAKKTYIASFAADGETQVRIRFNSQAQSFNLKPQGSIVFKQYENEIRFTLDKPCKLDIEPDGDVFGCLHLFAEAPEICDKGVFTNIIYFEKGFHTAENSKHIEYNKHGVPTIKGITNDTLIYAEQGAVVCAAVEIANASHIKLAGYGIFSLLERCYGAQKDFDVQNIYGGFRYWALPTVYIHAKCEDITIQDVTLLSEFRSVSIRNSKNILIDNVKAFSHSANGDGINSINVCNMEVKNCYVHSSDDCFALFTSVDSIPTLYDTPEFTAEPHVDNVTVHNCILWSNARIFLIGGHGTNSTEPHNTVENVRIYDCEIIGSAADVFGGRDYEYILYWSGLFRIISQSEQFIRNIHFENIRTDWLEGFEGKPFHIEVREKKDASYSERGGYRIENISFKNIQFINTPKENMPALIKSVDVTDSQYCVDGVTFENITFGGEFYSNIETVGNVKNIVIKET